MHWDPEPIGAVVSHHAGHILAVFTSCSSMFMLLYGVLELFAYFVEPDLPWTHDLAMWCYGGRDVTQKRQPFPSFCPADFELASKAANTALRLAHQIVASDPDSLVCNAVCHTMYSLGCLVALVFRMYVQHLLLCTQPVPAPLHHSTHLPSCWIAGKRIMHGLLTFDCRLVSRIWLSPKPSPNDLQLEVR